MKQRFFAALRRNYDLTTLRTSTFFRGDWYLYHYPDVRAAGVDAARHYLDHGAREGRNPSWTFSTSDYLERYPDVATSGMNPLLHFIRIGAGQGREPQTRRATSVAAPRVYTPQNDVEAAFARLLRQKRPANVLEVGTMQAQPGVSTHSMRRFPWVPARDYVRLDLIPGPDVDVVGDLHALPQDWTGRFDCFYATAVFEHLERPWIAAREVARVLAPGGIFWVSTHQCFPIHAHPHDYFRFSREALRLIFEDAGLVVDAADYRHRCAIVPPNDVIPHIWMENWNTNEPAFILALVAGHKTAA